jgi:hypothetical protein
MKKITKILLLLISISSYKGMYAQDVAISGTPSADGTKIQLSFSIPGLQGASLIQYAVTVSGPGAITSYDVAGKSLSITTQPNCVYDISATATYKILSATYSAGGSTIEVNTHTNSSTPPQSSPSCSPKFGEGFNFDQQMPDGTWVGEGEIIVSWGPTPPTENINIIFRYRQVGTSTWNYTPLIPAKGAGVVFNGQPAAWFVFGGLEPDGVEYEFQVATACSSTSVSSYSVSYNMTTLVD